VTDIAQRFGQNLKRHRTRLGLSQEELGARAGLHRTEISLLESGGREPRLTTLVRLAGSLGIPPERLVDGIVWRPRTQDGRFDVAPP